MKSLSGLRKKIEETIGRPILEKCCQKRIRGQTSEPTMIPPIPESKYIDILPETVQLEGQNLSEKELQDGYEAEVKVFRSFENLKRNVIVVHQLQYTHEQYSAFLSDHMCNKVDCKNGPEEHVCHQAKANVDGETDFVVMGDNFSAVFEVKGLKVSKNETCSCCPKIISKCDVRRDGIPSSVQNMNAVKFEACCKDATRQRRRMINLIKLIDPLLMVYEFTVFPNISSEDVDEQYLSDGTLLFGEDLDNFNLMIENFETKSPVHASRNLRFNCTVKRCVLGMWCIDQNSKWNFAKCNLPQCIKAIDDKLRRALVTRKLVDECDQQSSRKGKGRRKAKKYPDNPEMIDAPDLFKAHLNINCLTRDQLDVFESDKRFLWIEGPGGSGKTVAMLGKIIDIALTTPPEERIMIIVPRYCRPRFDFVEYYYETLKSVATCQIVEYDYGNDEDDMTMDVVDSAVRLLSETISNSNSKIVLLVIGQTVLSNSVLSDICLYRVITRFCHVFVDDYQRLADFVIFTSKYKTKFGPQYENFVSSGLLPVVKNNKDNNTKLWIFCDRVQSFSEFHIGLSGIRSHLVADADEFRSYFADIKELSVNLRNTYEISTVLSIIRKQCEGMFLTGTINWPQQVAGHFLRGTKPVIYLLKDDNQDALWKIVNKEFDNLKGSDWCLENSDIAVLLHSENCDLELTTRTVGIAVIKRKAGTGDHIRIHQASYCMSVEWPAVLHICRHVPLEQPDNSSTDVEVNLTIPILYTAISRARVYSVVIMLNYQPGDIEYTDNILSELRQRRDICSVIDVE